jgi:hypothetical protein
LRTNAIKGIITFALGGVILVFALWFILPFFNQTSISLETMMNGLTLSFIGFLFIGMGFWAIIKDAMDSTKK